MSKFKELRNEFKEFSLKLSPKTKLWIMGTVIVVTCAFGLVIAYTIILLQSGIGQQVEEKPAIDIYDQELDYDMGIAGSDYNERELYTDDHFISDKNNIIKNIDRQSYDVIDERISQLTAKYQFEGNHMSTITALERIMAFDPEEPGTTEDRLLVMSGIKDPEIYMHLFVQLGPYEQAMLIRHENVNILPAHTYTQITCEEKTCTINDKFYTIIGPTNYYELHLTYLYYDIVVCIVDTGSLQIFDINNTLGTLDTLKYNQ